MSPIIGSFASGSAFGAKGGKVGLQGLYDFTDAQFVAGRYGRQQPTLAQCLTGISSPSGGNIDWKDDTNFFNVSTGIQYWTVPYTAKYQFEAWGGIGRNGRSGTGGFGSRMRGDFDLIEGEIIRFIIGQWSQHTGVYGPPNPYGGGGAGGTFVTKSPYNSNASILLVAGGGNGGARANYPGPHAITGTNASGRPVGNGGGQSNQHGGAGGGGFFGDGPQSRPNTFFGLGGRSWNNGGRGGNGSQAYGNPGGQAPAAAYGEGGFGGGGGCDHQGGGGGGYTGGRYANFSTGTGQSAGSYNNGTNQLNYGGSEATAQQDRPTGGFSANGGQLRITVLG